MIVLDRLFSTYLKKQNYNDLSNHGITISDINPDIKNKVENFAISWGDPAYQIRGATVETGFFWEAIHIDKIGLYERASFNFPLAKRLIEDFNAKISFRQLQANNLLKPKFNQPSTLLNWDGVVIIGQHPGDRSIFKAGSTGDYHKFLDEACSYYGKKAFIKIHPVTMGMANELEIVRNIAKKYGSECGYVNTSVIDNAELVLVYNSTFVVDALIANKHVIQYAPGYFWQSGVAQYSSRKIPTKIENCNQEYCEKFLDFLIWKYCFHERLPINEIAEIIKTFESSKETFPLPEDLSYAGYLLRNKE